MKDIKKVNLSSIIKNVNQLKRYGVNQITILLIIILIFIGIFVVAYISTIPATKPKTENTQSPTPTINIDQTNQEYKVERVIDGDTILVKKDSQEFRVRYIGVNTPETVKPNSPVECFGRDSSEYNKKLVEGKTVILEEDIGDTDRNGRLLRYVYLKDESNQLIMVNKKLIEEGYASVMTVQPNVKYQEVFNALEKKAREEKKGLWAKCNI